VKNVDIVDRTKHCRYNQQKAPSTVWSRFRLDATTPAHQALCQVIAMKGGQSLGMNLRKPPGRPRKIWIQQMNVDIVESRRNEPQLPRRHDDYYDIMSFTVKGSCGLRMFVGVPRKWGLK